MRPVKAELTLREREVAAYLLEELTAKQTAKIY
jgi:DNA-binding CsgD family transcriptional regulator